MDALLNAVLKRITPTSLFCAHLVIHHQSAEKLLNRLQAGWMKRILGITTSVPRIVMMWELGLHDRASALVWMRALALIIRVEHDPKYLHELDVVNMAKKCGSAWTTHISTRLALLKVPKPPAVFPTDKQSMVKDKFKRFNKEILNPLVRQHELQSWNMLPKQMEYWSRHHPRRWTVKQLSKHLFSVQELQFWARLKLQGHFGEGGTDDGLLLASCRFCGKDEPETAGHVLSGCCQLTKQKCNELCDQFPRARKAYDEGWFTDFVLGRASPEAAAVACVHMVAALGSAARSRCVL